MIFSETVPINVLSQIASPEVVTFEQVYGQLQNKIEKCNKYIIDLIYVTLSLCNWPSVQSTAFTRPVVLYACCCSPDLKPVTQIRSIIVVYQ